MVLVRGFASGRVNLTRPSLRPALLPQGLQGSLPFALILTTAVERFFAVDFELATVFEPSTSSLPAPGTFTGARATPVLRFTLYQPKLNLFGGRRLVLAGLKLDRPDVGNRRHRPRWRKREGRRRGSFPALIRGGGAQPLSMTGLFCEGSIVRRSPPLSARGPSFGSVDRMFEPERVRYTHCP